MFIFICENCGYGMALSSGVPLKCSVCNQYFSYRRGTLDEYHKCPANDGRIKEVK